MAQSIRISKLMNFAIKVAENQAKDRNFYSPTFKDADYLNFIVSEWLKQNYNQNELFDMGYDEVIE